MLCSHVHPLTCGHEFTLFYGAIMVGVDLLEDDADPLERF